MVPGGWMVVSTFFWQFLHHLDLISGIVYWTFVWSDIFWSEEPIFVQETQEAEDQDC
jgi:hypothetical protein